MLISDDTRLELEKPLDHGRVKKDPKGKSYIEGWDAIATANRIFGFNGWNYEVTSIGQVATFHRNEKDIAVYEAKVRVEALGATRTDVGVGITAGDSPEAHETAIKGAVTDGLKRALRSFGDQFGNTLYDKESDLHKPAPRTSAPKRNDGLGRCEEHNEPWVRGRAGIGHVMPEGDPHMKGES